MIKDKPKERKGELKNKQAQKSFIDITVKNKHTDLERPTDEPTKNKVSRIFDENNKLFNNLSNIYGDYFDPNKMDQMELARAIKSTAARQNQFTRVRTVNKALKIGEKICSNEVKAGIKHIKL